MKLCLLLVLLPGLWAQPLVIDCGSAQDSGFAGGTAWTQADMGAGVLSTMRFGSRFSYRVPAPSGVYLVRFLFVEPNATAVGQRRFTISVNGQTSDPIDVFKEAGARPNGYRVDTTAVSYFGRIMIDFAGLVGNAIINAIEVYPLQAGQMIAESYECVKGLAFGQSPTAALAVLEKPGCSGIYLATFSKADGNRTDAYIMVPAPAGVPPYTDLATWRPAAIP